MSKTLPRVRMKVLACVLMAWPLFAHAQPSAAQNKAAAPVRSIPDETFQQWLKEDNRLIESILGSLKNIDLLLGDIERMIRQIPDAVAKPTPAPAPKPVVVEKTVIQEVEVPGPYGGWPITLASAGALALLAFWLGRKQATPKTASAALPVETPPAKPVAEKRAAPPSASPAAKPVAVAPVAPVTPVAPSAPTAPAAAPFADLPSVQPEPKPIATKPVAPQAASSPSMEPATSIEPSPSSASSGDQALELAEIMLSMGLGHGATQTLTEQIRNEPKQALRHWLKLLDIYRKNGQQEEFERSAEELRLHFNVRPEDWHAQPGTTQSLENFPHIAKRLVELWGKPDCLVYMQNLLDDNRGGARSGFPQSVAEELLMLTSVMREAYGFLPG